MSGAAVVVKAVTIRCRFWEPRSNPKLPLDAGGDMGHGLRMGRHSEFRHEIADEICHRISGGESVKRICSSEGMPSMQTVFKWLREQSSFADNYARAITERADAVFEEMFAIADDGSNDTYVDDEGNVKIDHDVINRSRLRIDTRKWALSRMNPKKYGDKIEQVHSGSVEVSQITRRVVDPKAGGK